MRILSEFYWTTLWKLGRIDKATYISKIKWCDCGTCGFRVGEHPKSLLIRDALLEAQMIIARSVIDAVLSLRNKNEMKIQIPLRTPLQKATVIGNNEVRDALQVFNRLIKDFTNIKELEFVESFEDIKFKVSPIRAKIGPVFKQECAQVLEALKNFNDTKTIRKSFEKDGFCLLNNRFKILPEMVQFETILPKGIFGTTFEGGYLYIDGNITPALKAEGLSREVTRFIQEMRKKNGFVQKQKIVVEILYVKKIEEMTYEEANYISMLEFFTDKIKNKVNAESLIFIDDDTTEMEFVETLESEDGTFFIGIEGY